jgi:hemolysin activation/secretion protein
MSLQPFPPPTDHFRLPTKESPCFTIKRILLVGDMAKKFQWALASANRADDGKKDPATNRCLGARGINLVMRRIQNAIVKRGYVTTRVLAKPQNLNNGILELILIPGRIHNIRFASKVDAYNTTKWNTVPTKPGDLFNLRDIEQALENFKRVPTAEADIQIIPSKGTDAKPGDSDLVIKWKQGFPLRLALAVDDSGTRATGKYLGNATISYDNWWALNDLFYFNFNHELGGKDPGKRGTQGYTGHYSLPFGYWLIGFTGSSNRYHQAVMGNNQTYIYSGESQNNEIKLSRLIYRDAVRKTTLSLSGWTRSSKNFVEDIEIDLQRRRMAGWEFDVNHREFIGSSILDTNLAYRRGTGTLDSLPANEIGRAHV